MAVTFQLAAHCSLALDNCVSLGAYEIWRARNCAALAAVLTIACSRRTLARSLAIHWHVRERGPAVAPRK